ncbi:MAG: DUF2599 domain-containing protein [Actinomycetia bacterium]|nr:DUF2599 domain-containing protein [Actinomycetes bacterium]MCH9800443.1 DUF2599 domain-containing protein [Actinomycetes bacterium]
MRKIITLALLIGLCLALGMATSATTRSNTASSPDPGASGSSAKGQAPRPTNQQDRRHRYVAKVSVVSESSGLTYRITPTRSGRLVPEAALDEMWRQVTRRGVPDQPNLRQQFRCHPLSMLARLKSSWDLESWRPAVGLADTMLAGCNPEP